jgi:hypothetical protein
MYCEDECEDETHPYTVILDDKDISSQVEMWKWCVEQWGRPRYNKPKNWTTDYVNFAFKFTNSKDRNWFLLRWS